jgi:hypothetical protein
MANLHSYALVFFGVAGDPADKQICPPSDYDPADTIRINTAGASKFHTHHPVGAAASNVGGAE